VCPGRSVLLSGEEPLGQRADVAHLVDECLAELGLQGLVPVQEPVDLAPQLVPAEVLDPAVAVDPALEEA
jgi:hypothetical protein